MPPEELERDDAYFFVPMPKGEVIIFWSTGHEMVWYFGDNASALSEYRRALTIPRHQVGQLPKRPSRRQVREHHVVELLLNRHWQLDPIRREEAMHAQHTWKSLDERKAAFDGKLSSLTLPSLSRRSVSLVEVDRFDQLLPAVANLPFPFSSYHKTIVIIGDDPNYLHEQDRLHLQAICATLIDLAVQHHDVAVIDRGHIAMVSQLLGARASDHTPTLVGVACAKDTLLPDAQSRTISEGTTPLESSHTIHFLVPGTGRVDEAVWLAKIASAFAGIDPSVALLLHGEEEAWADVFAQLDEHRIVVALDGTGGLADLLSAAARGEPVADVRAMKCVESGLIRTFPLDALDEIKRFLTIVAAQFPVDFAGNQVDLFPSPPRGPFAMEPLRAAGFVALEGTFYHEEYKADENLAKALCFKYYKEEGNTSFLLQKGWLRIDESGQVSHTSEPTREQMNTIHQIVVAVEHEGNLPDRGKRETARLYLNTIKSEVARLEKIAEEMKANGKSALDPNGTSE